MKCDPTYPKSGKTPTLHICIKIKLKAQFEAAAKDEGLSLAYWLKT
nr:toxin-antitoxin system HicB family antitoxin [Enterobacter ludwigii]